MQQMGEITHQENQAKGVTQSMREKRLELEKRAKALPYRPSIYIEIDRPAWTVGKKSFVTEAISLCGARNIFEDVELNALQAASESIIDKNPEFILAFNTREEEIRKRPGWQGIQALRENKIIVDFPEELLSHGNHRLMIGMQKFQDELILRMSNNGKSTNP
jgi:ABC-type Fe3+-hydroxamate transport system substrate-binding protein